MEENIREVCTVLCKERCECKNPGSGWAKLRERRSKKAANFSVCGTGFNKVIKNSKLILNEVKTAIAGNHKIFHCNPVWDPLLSCASCNGPEKEIAKRDMGEGCILLPLKEEMGKEAKCFCSSNRKK